MIDLSKMDKKSIGKAFDHSVLPKNTQEKDIRQGCREALQYHCAAFYSASTFWTAVIKEELEGSDLLIGTGIDFPFGTSPSSLKASETEIAIKNGCTVVDMVINIGALKDKRYHILKTELDDFKKAAGDVLTKAILEVCFLTKEEITACCELIKEAGLDMQRHRQASLMVRIWINF